MKILNLYACLGGNRLKWFADAFFNAKTKDEVGHIRSKTFPGIAKAMAEQWSSQINTHKNQKQ